MPMISPKQTAGILTEWLNFLEEIHIRYTTASDSMMNLAFRHEYFGVVVVIGRTRHAHVTRNSSPIFPNKISGAILAMSPNIDSHSGNCKRLRNAIRLAGGK